MQVASTLPVAQSSLPSASLGFLTTTSLFTVAIVLLGAA